MLQIVTLWNWRLIVVNIVGVLSESDNPRKYWSDLKKKLFEEEHNELSEKIGQLKLKSSDGKYYNSDMYNYLII